MISRTRTVFRIFITGASLHFQDRYVADGHGYLATPRSRNLLAAEETNWGSFSPDDPEPENCPQCLNAGGTRARCGTTEGRNYDAPRTARGGLMKSKVQAIYGQGEDVVLDVTLTAHHKGHFVFSGCPIRHGEIPSQRCFDGNQLTFVKDLLYGAKKDKNYPERAYIAPFSRSNPNLQGVVKYSFKMRLPTHLLGDLVLIQWYYLTANSCTHDGYKEYDWPWKDVGIGTLPHCGKVSKDGSGVPEQFWNCAEVKIQRRTNDAISIYKPPDNNRQPAPPEKNEPPKQKNKKKSSSEDAPPPRPTGPANHGSYECPRGAAGYFPTANCSGYMQCDAWGKARGAPVMCPSGTLFDVRSKVCNFARQVQCTGPRKETNYKLPDNSKQPGVAEKNETLKKNKKEKDSSSVDEPPSPPTVPAKNESYNCPHGAASYVPTADCSGYVQCDAGGKVAGGPLDCPPGMLFDAKINVCNFAKQVQCTGPHKERSGESNHLGKRKRPARRRHRKKGQPGERRKPVRRKRPSRQRH